MSNTAQKSAISTGIARVDMKFEVVVIPVSDVDRAKEFYGRLGWRLDGDFRFDNGFRVVQFTPPGSDCSIQFGTQITPAAPGSAQNQYLVVSDIEAARAELLARGVAVSEVFHPGTPEAQFRPDGRIAGPAPDHATYRSFATFRDPDGNGWLVQEVTTRLPGREWQSTQARSMDVATIAELLRETSEHHDKYEKTHGEHHWWDWYAPYLSARQNGSSPEEADAAANRYMEEQVHVLSR